MYYTVYCVVQGIILIAIIVAIVKIIKNKKK